MIFALEKTTYGVEKEPENNQALTATLNFFQVLFQPLTVVHFTAKIMFTFLSLSRSLKRAKSLFSFYRFKETEIFGSETLTLCYRKNDTQTPVLMTFIHEG